MQKSPWKYQLKVFCLSKTLCIKPDQHKKTLLKLLFMSHAQTILKLKFSQPYNIRKRVTNLVQLLLVSIMPNAWKTTRNYCVLYTISWGVFCKYVQSFISLMPNAFWQDTCPSLWDGCSWTQLHTALISLQRYENAPFDSKHAFLNTLLTFTYLFSVLIFLLEKTPAMFYLGEPGMLPVYKNTTDGSLLKSCNIYLEGNSLRAKHSMLLI